MSRFHDRRLPPIDVHAHIATDVTSEQLDTLGPSLTFAVTRSLDEAQLVRTRRDPGLLWGCGVHPGVPGALRAYNPEVFEDLLGDFVLVGEIGLDRKPTARQVEVLQSMLDIITTKPVVASLHSSGCPEGVVEALEATPHPGAILHWFTGDPRLVERAAAVGAYFSVNSSAKDELLRSLPPERVLTETDFPATRRSGSSRPAHIDKIESRLAEVRGVEPHDLRRALWRNLRTLFVDAGALSRLDRDVAARLIAA